jgi:hypothetical protein
MRRLLAGAVLLGSLTLGGAATREADHAYVLGSVSIYHGPGPAVAEHHSQPVACTARNCTVTLAIGKRDYGRFVKWCGSTDRDVMLSPGSTAGAVQCAGPSPWIVKTDVGIYNASQVLTAHDSSVTIDVTVAP